MLLYKFEAKNTALIFGDRSDLIVRPQSTKNIVLVAQYPDCSSFLVLSDSAYPGLSLQNSVPSDYVFTFRQEWGLTINDEVLTRVIETLRKESYPPLSDYADAFVKDDQAALGVYKEKCLAVKAKYTKYKE